MKNYLVLVIKHIAYDEPDISFINIKAENKSDLLIKLKNRYDFIYNEKGEYVNKPLYPGNENKHFYEFQYIENITTRSVKKL